MIDTRLLESGWKLILHGLGAESSQRHSDLDRTPQRAAKFLSECLSNEGVSNEDLAKRFGKCFPAPANGGPVIVRGIPIFSFCEHHIALMYDMTVAVAYLPRDWVLGLSKVSRIADAAARRLQIQERLTADIAEIITLAVSPRAVFVRVSGKHSCVTARGIQKDSVTVTESFRGEHADVELLRRCVCIEQ